MQNENEEGVILDENQETPEIDLEEGDGNVDWKAEAQALRDKQIANRERTRLLRQQLADKDRAIAMLRGTSSHSKSPGELDETQLDYLDLKGITEEEDIKILARHVQRTGETIRQALKDEYVQAKLEANLKAREVKSATPSTTKRGGNQVNDIASAIARFEQTGELPADYKLRSEVVNAISDKGHNKRPAWG
jgi:hypothetical protein